MNEPPLPPTRPSGSLSRRTGLSVPGRLLLLVMAAALPPLLFSVFQAHSASRMKREDAEQDALQLAHRIASRVDDHVGTVDALLIGLSRSIRVSAADVTHNDRMLSAIGKQLEAQRFLNLSVADRSGRVVGLSRRPTTAGPLLDVSDRKYFREALTTGGLGIGEPMTGRVSGQYSLALGRAVPGRDGKPVGVVAASTQLDQLSALLIASDLPTDAVVTLFDQNGVVLARSLDAERWVGRDVSAFASTRVALRERAGAREVVGTDGIARLTGYATAARVPWHIAVAVPSHIALAQVHAQEAQARILFAVSLTLSLLLAWMFARGIVRPVRALTADADAFAAGDLARRTSVRADGELGALAITFDRMAEALERRSEELGDSERRYRALFDTMPLPMWVYEVDSLRFVAVNDAAVAHYGYSRSQFLARTVLDIRSAEDANVFRTSVMPERLGATRGELYQHVTRDGRTIDVEISSDELTYGSTRVRLVVAIDVTERRRTEAALLASQEQLRQSQKMEAVGSLAGGIAHDFNNLLTAILGYCDLALEGLAPDATAAADVAEIRRAGLRAADLTRQLLAFSRRQVLKPLVFPLGPSVRQMENMLRRLISANIELDMRVAPDTPAVRADPTQLEQVILNLVVNARDAMSRGGRLVLRTGARELGEPCAVAGSALAPGRYAVLEVTDTGTGIAPEIRERLFEPFFTTKGRGQGTGLGLATVYGVMQQSGGGIEVTSTPGQGTSFTLYFPTAGAVTDEEGSPVRGVLASEARYHSPAAPVPSRETILLAEDDEAVRAIAQATLERAGYTVLAAADGRAALALAESYAGRIDLLLTDVIMPGMNGRELAETLAGRRTGLRVLFASGYSDDVLLDQGALAPGVTLLDKPFTSAVLAAKVAEVLGGGPLAVGG
ncbi:MAG: putative two-component hybrid sensor and regulator [Gemmatimonadetes bacterium]|jgi:two-component system cell cycle sensor histidine kinase/response regulator CckA|nr:putative two-component hybrid sensor and regulator [Gemmatimonadota bacterium]